MPDSDEEFHMAIVHIIEKYGKDPNTCFEKMMKLNYPGSNHYVKLEHARFFYEKYSKLMGESIKIDKDFTKNAYNKNSKIFKDAYLTEFKPKDK